MCVVYYLRGSILLRPVKKIFQCTIYWYGFTGLLDPTTGHTFLSSTWSFMSVTLQYGEPCFIEFDTNLLLLENGPQCYISFLKS